jgi:hypothetical protein
MKRHGQFDQERYTPFCVWFTCKNKPMIPDELPLCKYHVIKVYGFAQRTIDYHKDSHETLLILSAISETEGAKRGQVKPAPVVYYIRGNNHIKIGYTTDLLARVTALAVLPSDVIAAEPGDRPREQARHAEFAQWRIDRELFTPSPELFAHAGSMRNTYGDPFALHQRIRTARKRSA